MLPSQGGQMLPPQGGDFQVSPTPFIMLLGLGFLVAAFGHLVRSRTIITTGVLMIFLATVAIPLALAITR